MQKEFYKILSEEKYKPENGFAAEVWLSIKREEKKNARRKLWLLSTLGISSLSAAIPTASAALRDLAGSGFYEYLSLAFSNGGRALEYWKELSLSLLESLPVTGLSVSLFLVFVFFLFARQASRQIESAALSF